MPSPPELDEDVVKLRAAVEHSPSGLLMVDDEGRIALVNNAIERLFGYERSELLGQSVEMLVPQAVRKAHPMFRDRFIGTPSSRPMGAGRDLFGVRKDGTEVPVEIGLTPVFTEAGLFVLSSIVDISARKQAEAEQRALEEELRQSQKLEAIGTLAGGIAHDFNNILSAIIGLAEMAGSSAETPDVREDMADLLEAANRGKELVDRILRFSRRQTVDRAPVDLSATVRDATQLLRAALPASIELDLQADAKVPRVKADTTSIHQILMNLATNSAHAMPEGGSIAINVEPIYVHDSVARAHPSLHEGPHVMLTVKDTGEGIDPTVLSRVFEPFFTTKSSGQGTGLGLAMVHRLVLDHDGAIDLESEPGKGTLVRCYFPAIESEQQENTVDLPTTVEGEGRQVLYVDDEPILVRLGERRLTHFGFEVTGTTSSTRALELVRDDPEHFDLVVTDNSMPGLSGIGLARGIHAVAPDMPILLLSGYIDDLPIDALAKLGVRRVLQKPVRGHQLAITVDAMIRGVSRTSPGPLYDRSEGVEEQLDITD